MRLLFLVGLLLFWVPLAVGSGFVIAKYPSEKLSAKESFAERKLRKKLREFNNLPNSLIKKSFTICKEELGKKLFEVGTRQCHLITLNDKHLEDPAYLEAINEEINLHPSTRSKWEPLASTWAKAEAETTCDEIEKASEGKIKCEVEKAEDKKLEKYTYKLTSNVKTAPTTSAGQAGLSKKNQPENTVTSQFLKEASNEGICTFGDTDCEDEKEEVRPTTQNPTIRIMSNGNWYAEGQSENEFIYGERSTSKVDGEEESASHKAENTDPPRTERPVQTQMRTLDAVPYDKNKLTQSQWLKPTPRTYVIFTDPSQEFQPYGDTELSASSEELKIYISGKPSQTHSIADKVKDQNSVAVVDYVTFRDQMSKGPMENLVLAGDYQHPAYLQALNGFLKRNVVQGYDTTIPDLSVTALDYTLRHMENEQSTSHYDTSDKLMKTMLNTTGALHITRGDGHDISILRNPDPKFADHWLELEVRKTFGH